MSILKSIAKGAAYVALESLAGSSEGAMMTESFKKCNPEQQEQLREMNQGIRNIQSMIYSDTNKNSDEDF